MKHLRGTKIFFQSNKPSQNFPFKQTFIREFNQNGFLAYAAFLIECFSMADQNHSKLAEAFFPYLNHPLPSLMTPRQYLHEISINASRSDSLHDLMSLFSLALFDQALPHFDSTDITLALKQLPHKINHLNVVLQKSLKEYPIRYEIKNHQILAKKFPPIHQATLENGLLIHWKNNQCIISAKLHHGEWFNSITPEKIQNLQNQLSTYALSKLSQPINVKCTLNKSFQSYSEIYQQIFDLDFSSRDLIDLYCDALNRIIETPYSSWVFGTQRHFEWIEYHHHPDIKTQEDRLKQMLIHALSRLVVCKVIPDLQHILGFQKTNPQEISYTRIRQ